MHLASRVILTPPPELDLDLLFEPSAPTVVCTLPPLVAETASGRTVNFKRRNKLRPAALAVSSQTATWSRANGPIAERRPQKPSLSSDRQSIINSPAPSTPRSRRAQVSREG